MGEVIQRINQNRDEVLRKLSQLAKGDPIPAIMAGDTAVGMTLLDALGVEHSSLTKPTYHGIIINAFRRTPSGKRNRVNLFAQVPEWDLSDCKSSAEILNRHGYDVDNLERRLYCTVSARRSNSQGLLLQVDRTSDTLKEVVVVGKAIHPVATWKLCKLTERLVDTHPETMWVTATVFKKNTQEYYQYREVIYTGPPNVEIFPDLLESGTVTLDHLIDSKNGKVKEKGPLFKIDPENFTLLFPIREKYDLMAFDYC